MIVAGFGYRTGARAESLHDALAATGGEVTALATLADKADSPAFLEFARDLGLPVHRIAQTDLDGIETYTISQASQNARQTGSVAEATALAAAGPGARLIRPRQISSDRMATCALAETTGPLPDTGETP